MTTSPEKNSEWGRELREACVGVWVCFGAPTRRWNSRDSTVLEGKKQHTTAGTIASSCSHNVSISACSSVYEMLLQDTSDRRIYMIDRVTKLKLPSGTAKLSAGLRLWSTTAQ